jgi:hypothetical protein
MEFRRQVLFVLLPAFWSLGATVRTPNFVVHAANEQVAQQVGQYAEKYRREKALEWLNKEMPPWGQRCPLVVKVTPGGAGGATTFQFDRGAILSQEMQVDGSLERILHSVLPHEITHTVFAYHFRCPLPRWADEGGSVLSEDDIERRRHDDMVRQCLAGGRAFRLRVLFDMKNYPSAGGDVATLYAQGYSLCRFLVETHGRQAFLDFVAHGMRNGWDQAVRNFYGMNRVEDLEEHWLSWMRGTFRPDAAILAKNAKPGAPQAARVGVQLRPPQTADGPAGVVRAASPDDEGRRSAPVPRPGLPPSPEGWSPVHVPAPPSRTPPARLLPPVVDPATGTR